MRLLGGARVENGKVVGGLKFRVEIGGMKQLFFCSAEIWLDKNKMVKLT